MISSMRGGGSEQQTLLLLRHLDRHRFEPFLCLTQAVGHLLPLVPEDVPITTMTCDKPGVYFPGRQLRAQVRAVRDWAQRQNLDVIYDRTFGMTMIASAAVDALGTPRVSTIVSPPDRAVPSLERRFQKLKIRRLSAAYRRSHTRLAVSRLAAKSAIEFYELPESAVHVIPNPVDVANIKRQAETGRSVHLPAFNDPAGLHLVCLGRMSEEKGQADLLEAMRLSQIRDDHGDASKPALLLTLVGDGPDRAMLESLVTQLPHPDRVRFAGHFANPYGVLAAADGLVLPSHFEGMPNVVLEAMALSVPVLASRCGGTLELELSDPTIRWFTAGDPASLADALENFRDDPAGNSTRVRAATRHIKRFHEVSTVVGQIEAKLMSAAAGDRSRKK